ncbi:O-antigen ligase family protein [Rossellomorea aquimaris]|uniref:O-antigen ligase family protein n=1 Tax=Rossellomorea aquimaris TaxID=189382 RepID=UPI001CD49C5B|nr:O-antigen ligase family protein [Rossellomorea aquimaris]MCA1060804.1 O-antigen ligase family protein [Rossellomorea aquimaris]
MNMRLRDSTQLNLFLFIIALIIFKPSPGMLLGGGIVNIIVLGVEMVAGVILLLFLRNQTKYPMTISQYVEDNSKDYVTIFILLTIISLFISNTWGMFKSPKTSYLVDFIEGYRFVMYLIFYLAAKYVTLPENSIKKLYKPAFIMILIVEIIGILQFFNIFNFNNHIGLLYILSERHYDMILDIHRIPSTFFNPNLYGTFLVLSAAIVIGYMSYKGKFTWKPSLLLFTIFVSVYFTTSRTAVLTIIGMLAYWIIIYSFFMTKFSFKRLASSTIVLVVFLMIGSLLVPQIRYLDYASKQITSDHEDEEVTQDNADVQEDGNGQPKAKNQNNVVRKVFKKLESVSSFQKRFEFWEMNFEKFMDSPILGNGLMKNSFISFADNQYLYVLARYGLVGFIIYAVFYVSAFFKTLFMLKKETSHEKKTLALGINLSIAGFAFAGLTSEALFNLQTITLLFVLFGLLYNRTLKSEKEMA